MDKALLEFIAKACATADSTVFTAEDFFQAYGEWDESALSRALDRLEEGGYICIKYASDDTYCVRLLPKGRAFPLREEERLTELFCERERVWKSAFFGGLFGGAIGGLLSVLISLLFR